MLNWENRIFWNAFPVCASLTACNFPFIIADGGEAEEEEAHAVKIRKTAEHNSCFPTERKPCRKKRGEEKEEIQKFRAAHQIRENARLKSLFGLRYESPFASRKTHARQKRAAGQSAKSIIFSKWIFGKGGDIASNYALVSCRICKGKSSKLPYGKNTDGRTWKKFFFPRPEEVSFIRRRKRETDSKRWRRVRGS